MPAYTASVTIAATPDAVFPLVADLARHGEWSADPLTVTPAADGRFTSSTTSKGKAIEAELAVVETQPPTRFVFIARDLTGEWRHTFTLAPAGDGTTVTRRIEGKLSGAQLLLFWVVLLPIKKPNAAKALARLKELAERGPA